MMDEEQVRSREAGSDVQKGAERDAQRVQELERELAAAEATIEALMEGEVDAVIHPGRGGAVLLHEAQKALRESEKRWRAVFETALDAIFVIDDAARFLEVNDAACELLGLPKEQLLERDVGTVTPPDYDFEGRWSSFLKSKRTHGTIPVHRPDGDVRQTEFSGVADFMPGRHLFIVRDVTERREMERQREQALYELGERVKEATLLHRAGYLLNDTGGTVGDILDDLVALIPPAWQYPEITAACICVGERETKTDNYAETPWRQRSHFRGGEDVSGVVEVVYLEERPPEAEGPFLAEERRTLDALAGMIQSALERELAQERLRESEARYRTLFETMVQGVVYQDASGRIVDANPAAERILGVTLEEMTGLTALDPRWRLVRPDGTPFPAEEAPAEIALRTGEEIRNVIVGVYNPTAEEYRWLNVHAVPQFRPGKAAPYGVYTTFEDVTERRQAEERLRFQAQLLDSVREAVAATDLDERIIYWGKGAEALYGYTAEEMAGEANSKLFVGPQPKGWMDVVLETGSWRGECRHRRKDGETFWAHVSMSLVRDRAGEPVGFIGIGRDVTQRKRHEQELEAVAAVGDALRTALRPQEILSVVLDELEGLLQVENVAAIMADREQGDVVVEQMQGTWPDITGMRLQRDEGVGPFVIRTGEPFVTEDLGAEPLFLRPDILHGKTAAVCLPLVGREDVIGALWAARPEPFAATEVHLMSAVADIASGALQRADLYERLEGQALQLQRIVDSVPEGLLLLDGERRVLLANPEAARKLRLLAGWEEGAVAESVVGRPVTHLNGRPLEAFLEPPPENESAHLLEARGRRFEVSVRPLGEAAERGWVVIARDVTEEHQLQERVQQQERLASLGQLAAGIAHDFNNVMSAIFLYTQVLQQRPGLDERDRGRLDLIYRQAQHATNLIRQILDFSRRAVMERSALDLVPFFKEMLKLWRRTLPETISLQLHHDAARYVVDADPTRLQQAMMNLAINARDAMPDGGELSVRLASLDLQPGDRRPLPDMEPGVWLELEVSDSGQGIGEEALPHVFDPFFTTKPVGKGTGLGLSQVYGIIRQHGGHIRVASRPGEGTTFTIYLPLLQKEAEVVEETIPAMPETAGGGRRVLVVEDEEAARLALVESLGALGYEALGAENGAAALSICRDPAQQVDLVVSDLVMPEMGGTELYHVLREEFPEIRMVLMSGYPLDGESRELLEREAVVWIQKPFSVNDLDERLNEAFGRAGAV